MSARGPRGPFFLATDQVCSRIAENLLMQAHFPFPTRRAHAALWLPLLLLLAGCDQLGIETPAMTAAKKEAEGRAIGSACRHAIRSIEDCYRNNPKAPKAAIFDGWREMDSYMRENDIAGMPYQGEPTAADSAKSPTQPVEGKDTPQTKDAANSQGAGVAKAGQVPASATPPSGGIPLIQGLPQRPNVAPTR
jgi:hypothetical protein